MVIGKVLTIDELFEMGNEAVFIGSGAGLPRFMNIPGESLKGVYSANEFLTRSNLMKAYLPTSKTPIRTGKKVAVVGGGPGGMYAALTAAERGHRVTLMDNREKLGGTLWYTTYDCHKDDMRKFRDHLANRVYRAGVDVQLGVTVTKETIEQFNPDAVILAIGEMDA